MNRQNFRVIIKSEYSSSPLLNDYAWLTCQISYYPYRFRGYRASYERDLSVPDRFIIYQPLWEVPAYKITVLVDILPIGGSYCGSLKENYYDYGSY